MVHYTSNFHARKVFRAKISRFYRDDSKQYLYCSKIIAVVKMPPSHHCSLSNKQINPVAYPYVTTYLQNNTGACLQVKTETHSGHLAPCSHQNR